MSMPFKVMTLNTYLLCVGPKCVLADSPDPNDRAKKLGEWIRRHDPDIVLLQEVWQERHFKRIAQAAGLVYAFHGGTYSESGILSKFPLSEARFVPLKWQASRRNECKIVFAGYRFGVILAKVEVAPGQRIVIGSYHGRARFIGTPGFADAADEVTPERKINLLEIVQALREFAEPGEPIILGGDFNMNQISEEYPFLMRYGGLRDSFREIVGDEKWRKETTYSDANPLVQAQGLPNEGILDYVFASPAGLKILDSRILKDVGDLTDHYGVMSTFEKSATAGERYDPPRPERGEMDGLIQYVRNVKSDLFCKLSAMKLWGQKRKVEMFLSD